MTSERLCADCAEVPVQGRRRTCEACRKARHARVMRAARAAESGPEQAEVERQAVVDYTAGGFAQPSLARRTGRQATYSYHQPRQHDFMTRVADDAAKRRAEDGPGSWEVEQAKGKTLQTLDGFDFSRRPTHQGNGYGRDALGRSIRLDRGGLR
jgi:hypothetical protein